MFSFNSLSDDSRTVARIVDKKKKTKETLYFTEKSRDLKGVPDDFDRKFRKYGNKTSKSGGGFYTLDDGFAFEMIPHSKVTQKFPRFVNYYLAKSNSGKSFQIATYIRAYLKEHPKNTVYYASANPLRNDDNYKDLVDDDRVQEIDLLSIDTVIDFKQLRDTLLVFDDCDSALPASLSDLDPDIDPSRLSVADKVKGAKLLKNKTQGIKTNLSDSIISLLNCGRKNNISIIAVGHKYNDGDFQCKLISESTGVVLFPYTTTRAIFSTFLINKLSFNKEEVKDIETNLEFFQYDFFFVNNSGKRFIMTNDTLKLY